MSAKIDALHAKLELALDETPTTVRRLCALQSRCMAIFNRTGDRRFLQLAHTAAKHNRSFLEWLDRAAGVSR